MMGPAPCDDPSTEPRAGRAVGRRRRPTTPGSPGSAASAPARARRHAPGLWAEASRRLLSPLGLGWPVAPAPLVSRT